MVGHTLRYVKANVSKARCLQNRLKGRKELGEKEANGEPPPTTPCTDDFVTNIFIC